MTYAEQMTEFSHYADSEQAKPGCPIKDFLVDYRGNETLDRSELIHQESMNELDSLIIKLVPKVRVHMKLIPSMSALSSRLGKFFLTHDKVKLDNECKSLIPLLVAGWEPRSAETALNLKRAMGTMKLDDEESEEVGASVDQNSDSAEGKKDDEEKNENDDSLIEKSKQAEDAIVQLITRRSNQIKSVKEGNDGGDDGMYPFQVFEKGEKFSGVPPPKVRSGDVVEVTFGKDFECNSGFVIKAGAAVRVYVISLTSFGMLTGIIQSNKRKYWVYFPIHFTKQRVLRGVNWN